MTVAFGHAAIQVRKMPVASVGAFVLGGRRMDVVVNAAGDEANVTVVPAPLANEAGGPARTVVRLPPYGVHVFFSPAE